MIERKEGNIQWLEFKLFAGIKGLTHGVFLRHGGLSKAPFDSLNLGAECGDELEAVLRNRELALSALKGTSALVTSKQVHGDHLEVIGHKNLASTLSLLEEGCDGLFTQEKGIALLIKHADCQGALFYDPIERVVALIHCGWRGNVKNIYGKTISYFEGRFGSKKENILVGISPSLGPWASEFVHYRTEFPNSFLPFQFKENYFDLWAIAQMQLENAGILRHHIEIARRCTFTETKDFFSYRKEKRTGRNGSIVFLH